MDLQIADKLAVITGASGGLGSATAEALLDDQARLLLTDADEDQLLSVAERLRHRFSGAEIGVCAADLTAAADLSELGSASEALGGADIVVHAAGVTGAKGDPLELTDDDWEHAWNIDFMSAVRVARAFIPGMRAKGWGRVVYVTSENAVQPYTDEMVYNVAKAALVTLTKGLGQAYGADGVLVNAVAPAFIETDMTDQMMEQRAEELGVSLDEAIESFLEEERPHLVVGRRGRPDEVAAVIAVLCSDRASFVVGSNYRVDGGSIATTDT